MKQLDIDARLKFLEWVGGNPKSLEALAGNIFELHEGAWAQSFIDCVYQYSWHHKPDLYDKYILFDTIQELNGVDGSYLVFQVRVGDLPYADKDVTGNNQVLSRLPPPFAAAFTGGNQGEDGYFSWVSPVHIPIKVKD
uniref:hypothetical protein n=1 Tax=Atopomonas hussainii TaxID=1429083 RepID=UPI000B1CC9F7